VKYMMILFGDPEPQYLADKDWSIPELVRFMHQFNEDITRSGELVTAEGLTHSSQGKTVRFTDGAVAVTDGPYTESKEVLAGFWIVDVESEARVIELARRVVTFTTEPLEIRRIGDAPPEM
jgi:hypothetical protein